MLPVKEKVEVNGQTLYLGDCTEVVPLLGQFDAVVTDPPYGIGKALVSGGTGRGFHRMVSSGADEWDHLPTPEFLELLISLSEYQIFWGGNYLPLPPTKKPLCWDKKRPNQKNLSEWEMAWTSLSGRAQKFDYCANGGFVSSEANVHPTQKPIPLMEWCLNFIPAAETILDPYMGSGTTLVACVKLGRAGVGVETRKDFFDIAVSRISKTEKNPPELFSCQHAKQDSFL